MKIWKRRAAGLFLAAVLAVGMLPPVPVKASAATISAEASTEIMSLIWSFLINGMLVSGADKLAEADYNTEKNLFVAFMDYMSDALVPLPGSDTKITLADGTYITMADLINSYTDGTGALQIPDEPTWETWRVINGGNAEPDPEEPEEPEDPKLFNKIQQIMIGSGFLAEVVGFIKSMFNKEIVGLDPSLYFSAGYGFTSYDDMLLSNGSYRIYAEGNYTHKGNSIKYPDSYFKTFSFAGECMPYFALTGSVPVAVLFDSYIEFYWLSGRKLYSFDSYCTSASSVRDIFYSLETGEQQKEDSRRLWRIGAGAGCSYSTNVPVYASSADAKAEKNILNGLAYDFPGLINSSLETLAPLTGINLNPAALPGLMQALLQGLAGLPAPGTDPAANTDDYKEAMENTVDDYIQVMPAPLPFPDPSPSPEPLPDPEPEPVPEPAPEPAPDMDLNNYAVDLTGLFPFCIPFDYLSLLKALSAEPDAPCFEIPLVVPMLGIDERYRMDLEVFDDAMAIIRRLELVGFVISLMFITHKMIKW